MYCPNGTRYAEEFKCPRGTYNNKTQLQSAMQCVPCPGGYYCDQEGQETYTKNCSEGRFFYCV